MSPPAEKGALARAPEEHARDVLAARPPRELRVQRTGHRQGEGVAGLLRVEGRQRQASARRERHLLEADPGRVRHQPLTQRGGRFSRNALTPSCWSAVSKRSTNASRSG